MDNNNKSLFQSFKDGFKDALDIRDILFKSTLAEALQYAPGTQQFRQEIEENRINAQNEQRRLRPLWDEAAMERATYEGQINTKLDQSLDYRGSDEFTEDTNSLRDLRLREYKLESQFKMAQFREEAADQHSIDLDQQNGLNTFVREFQEKYGL